MGLEAVTWITDLVVTNPVGATDPKSQGDDHIRNIKTALKNCFPNINAAVTATPAQLNNVVSNVALLNAANTFTAAPQTISTGASVAVQAVLNTTGTTTAESAALQFSRSSVAKGFIGTAAAAGSLITGGAQDDLCIRSQGGNIDFSINSGASISAQILTGTGITQFTASSASTINLNNLGTAGTGAMIALMRSGTVKGYIGSPGSAGGYIASIPQDGIAIRSEGFGIAFSCDSGATQHFGMGTSGQVGSPMARADEIGRLGAAKAVIATPTNIDSTYCSKLLYPSASADLTFLNTCFDGFTCQIINNSGGNILLKPGASAAMYMAGNGFGGGGTQKTLAHGGMCTVTQFGSGNFIACGSGLS